MATTEPALSSISLPPPSRTRYIVLAYLCGMAFILYLDRICMGQAAPEIQLYLELSNTQMTFIHMAFTLAYGLFEVTTGRWGDRFGSRRVLTRIVLVWSLFTLLTGLVWRFSLDSGYVIGPFGDWSVPLLIDGFVLIVLIRFLFGAGEAGAYPNAARVLSRWFPLHERGRIQGIMLSFAQVGGAVAPGFAGILIKNYGWRLPFVLFGLLGAVWAAFFYFWFRDDPNEHPKVNAAERQLIGPPRQQPHSEAIPWRAARCHPSIWLLGTIMTLASFVSYMYFSWYPTYLRRARGVAQDEAGFLTSLVLGTAMFGTLAGGFMASWLVSYPGNRQRARRVICCLSYGVAALFLLGGIQLETPLASAACAAVSCFAMFSYQVHWWGCVAELSGKHLGAMFGLLNGVGVFGAMSSQYFFGAFADWRGSLGYVGRAQWDPVFYFYVGALFLTALCWLGVDTSWPIARDDDGPTAT